ncbi:hypothetical protein BTO30_09415 [Domibacillus antri]|uniref:Uncharacterized protein n=1 Tax=Domibacillus antri TaxID=1714264 RepID=A0A1Q8Q576_9BACI|nr:hypothetical protein BTO30_09415 [Domibacillus antri]
MDFIPNDDKFQKGRQAICLPAFYMEEMVHSSCYNVMTDESPSTPTPVTIAFSFYFFHYHIMKN